MKIAILGYMGSGKSTVGKALSDFLTVDFFDLDELISIQEKMTVSQIFDVKGEIYFRKKEHFYLNSILDKNTDFVLSLGGGTPIFYNQMNVINEKTTSFYLQASPTFLAKRLVLEKNNRPLIKHLNQENITEFIAKHLFERNLYYQQANYTINIEHKSPDEIVKEIISIIKI